MHNSYLLAPGKISVARNIPSPSCKSTKKEISITSRKIAKSEKYILLFSIVKFYLKLKGKGFLLCPYTKFHKVSA